MRVTWYSSWFQSSWLHQRGPGVAPLFLAVRTKKEVIVSVRSWSSSNDDEGTRRVDVRCGDGSSRTCRVVPRLRILIRNQTQTLTLTLTLTLRDLHFVVYRVDVPLPTPPHHHDLYHLHHRCHHQMPFPFGGSRRRPERLRPNRDRCPGRGSGSPEARDQVGCECDRGGGGALRGSSGRTESDRWTPAEVCGVTRRDVYRGHDLGIDARRT